MAFSDKQLNTGEQVVLDLRPHWWFFANQTVALVGAVILGVIALTFFGGSALVSLLAASLIVVVLAWFIARYVVWTTTNFVLTSDRLINRSGVFSRQGIEIPLERINTVFFSQNLFERVIGAGNLVVESAGEMGRQQFAHVRQPLDVQNEIYSQMEDNENRKFDRVNTAVAGPGPSIPEQIEQLDSLRQRGIISDDEFSRKKTELLNRM